jgi:16S rRNA processing protein RimM
MTTMIAIGRLIKPHGLRGELVFLPYVVEMALLPDLIGRSVVLEHPKAPTLSRTVSGWRQLHKRVLMQFDGCRDISQAEILREYEVLIARHVFEPLPEGEYYWFEIEGLAVYARDGEYLGVVTEIIYTGSNDVYVVRDAGASEWMVPALCETVSRIDVEQGEMHLRVQRQWLEF